MIRKALVTSSVALIFCSASTVLAGPPVKVEVVVEDEDDFFEEKKAKPKTRTEEVREHANEMFDELEKEEQKHKNDNTNVVNVVVVDGEKKQEETQIETPETPDVPPVVEHEHRHRHHRHRLTREEKRRLRHEERMARLREKEERRMQKLRLREEKLRLRHQELQMRQDLRCQKLEYRGWWNRPSWAEGGDFLLHGILGFNGQGAFGGLGGEYFATDVLGVRAQAQFMRLGQDDDPGFTGPNFNVNQGGVWANANDVDYPNLRHGHTHLIDAMLAVHVIPQSRFDLFPTVGLSYMGYGFDYGDREEKGGAGYLRLGAGFNIVVKRFYAGLDFGWYPLALFHHGTGPSAVATLDQSLLPDDGNNTGNTGNRDNDEDQDDGDGRGRFNAKRMTLTAHLGIRF